MTAWTIRLSLACLAGAMALGAGKSTKARRWRLHRGIWTAGCILAWVHVAAAFHFFHAWSYAHAAEETSRRTVDVVGRSWGGEIWFNFAFIGVWAADVGWRWMWPNWADQVAIPTGLGVVRNLVVVTSADAVLAVGGRHGTLSEIGLALRMGRQVVTLGSWRIESDQRVGGPRLHRARDPREAAQVALRLAKAGPVAPG